MATRHLIPAALLWLACFIPTANAALPVTNDPAYTAPSTCVGASIGPLQTTTQLQTALNAGGTICGSAGVYHITGYLTLPTNTQLICRIRRSCIITGDNIYYGGFTSAFGTTGQRVKGFVIRDFTDPPGFPEACLQMRSGSVMEDNDISTCRVGISMNAGATALNNHLHHNRCNGVSGGPGNGIVVDLNEIDNNNTAHEDISYQCSGVKIVGSQAGATVTFSRNFVHDNYGQGLWCDGNCHDSLIENNVVTANRGVGIDWEISWNAIIRYNVLAGNNSVDFNMNRSCYVSGQINVNNSQGVDIYGNQVDSYLTNPICLSNTTRAEDPWFPQFLSNVTVHDNVIKMAGATQMGMVGDTMPTGISFTHNTYYLTTSPTQNNWAFFTYPLSKAQWLAAGQDATGIWFTW